MYKPILKIEREEDGKVILKFNKGNFEHQMWFDSEAQFQGFYFALSMMMSMGAASFGCCIPGPGVNDNQDEATEGDNQPG